MPSAVNICILNNPPSKPALRPCNMADGHQHQRHVLPAAQQGLDLPVIERADGRRLFRKRSRNGQEDNSWKAA